jgi:hypothetical protein
MLAALSRRLLLRMMHKRAERHAGCRIDTARLMVDPEYASAIRTLARFTLDEELRAMGAIVDCVESRAAASAAVAAAHANSPRTGARILPFRRQSST